MRTIYERKKASSKKPIFYENFVTMIVKNMMITIHNAYETTNFHIQQPLTPTLTHNLHAQHDCKQFKVYVCSLKYSSANKQGQKVNHFACILSNMPLCWVNCIHCVFGFVCCCCLLTGFWFVQIPQMIEQTAYQAKYSLCEIIIEMSEKLYCSFKREYLQIVLF